MLESEQATYMRAILDTQLFQDYVTQITEYEQDMKKMTSNEVFKYGQEFLALCKEDNFAEIMEAEGDIADLINKIDNFIKTSQRIKIMYLMLRRTSPVSTQKQESKEGKNDGTSPVEKKKLFGDNSEEKVQKERAPLVILEQEAHIPKKYVEKKTVAVALTAADKDAAIDADDDLSSSSSDNSGEIEKSDEDFDPKVVADNTVEIPEEMDVAEIMSRPKLWRTMLKEGKVIPDKTAKVEEEYPLDDEEKLVDLGTFNLGEDCACFRTMKMIHCVQCGHMMVARLRRMCSTHPNVTFLLDVTACAKCTSSGNKLKEYEMPDSMIQQQFPKMKKPILLQSAVSRAKELINKRTVTPAFQDRSNHQSIRRPSTPAPASDRKRSGFPKRSPVAGQRMEVEPFQSCQRATDRLRNKN